MNHNTLKNIIFDHHDIIKSFDIVERDYTFDMNANYVLVGLRRAGKSTLLNIIQGFEPKEITNRTREILKEIKDYKAWMLKK